jgi:pimeloyl-ACP methyl ester carboxylesterase
MMERFAGMAADVQGEEDDACPLVLVHGLSFDRTMWRPAVEELMVIDPRRRIIAFDLPGHGESSAQTSYDVASVVASLHRAVEEAEVDSPVVVGHSIGAVIVTVYAVQHPVRGVVNVDQPLFTAPFAQLLQSLEPQLRGPEFPEIWQMFEPSFHTELLPPAAQEIVRTTSRPRQELVLGYWQEVLDQPVESLNHRVELGLAQLREKHLPYVVVAGDTLDPAYAEWLNEMLPEARVVVLPNSGHFPHLAHPAAFAKILADTASW